MEGIRLIQFSVLASGSTGNSIYVGTDQHHFLFDAGLSGKRIEASLNKIGIDPTKLNGIFVSHEHDDHVRGVGVLSRKYSIPIYANEATINNLPQQVGKIDQAFIQTVDIGYPLEFGQMQIETFGISHDAAEPVGFTIQEGEFKLSIVTDLGYVSHKIKDKITGSDFFIFESNHDVNLLRMSSYPWSIKQRILSDVGHLSNEAAAEALLDVINENTQRIYLAHLSKENNLPDLAKLTVKNILEENGITESHVQLMDTYFNDVTPLERLDSKKQLILK